MNCCLTCKGCLGLLILEGEEMLGQILDLLYLQGEMPGAREWGGEGSAGLGITMRMIPGHVGKGSRGEGVAHDGIPKPWSW